MARVRNSKREAVVKAGVKEEVKTEMKAETQTEAARGLQEDAGGHGSVFCCMIR